MCGSKSLVRRQTMSFLGFSARVPLALLAVGVYLLGTVTGGSLLALPRQSIEAAYCYLETFGILDVSSGAADYR